MPGIFNYYITDFFFFPLYSDKKFKPRPDTLQTIDPNAEVFDLIG